MRAFSTIRPQDIAILLKITALKGLQWRQADLAEDLCLSQTEISFSLERCRTVGFIDANKTNVYKSALLEFLIHGLKYVFPAQPGPLCRGVPTAHLAPPLSDIFPSKGDDCHVWPSDDGTVRGQSVEPLYPKAPAAARADRRLYELLALVDIVRLDCAREQARAIQELTRKLS